jgi:hypothetical protein
MRFRVAGTSAEARSQTFGVVYLARCEEGRDAFSRFIQSYNRSPAGCDHDLIIIYKGFTQRKDLLQARAVFGGVPHIGVELDDVGFDIGSYAETSRRVHDKYLVFLNSFTELVSPGWLAKMSAHAERDGVGITGAMGSYESLFNSVGLINQVIKSCNRTGMPYDRTVHKYWDFIISKHCRGWIERAEARGAAATANHAWPEINRRINRAVIRWWWIAHTGPGMSSAAYRLFPGFPKPHIRSNGFMVARERLSRFSGAQFVEKLDACAFESSTNSLTSQLRREGLAAIVVGHDGRGYDVSDWPKSGTFRLGSQANLLLHDNQSRAYAEISPESRETLARMTWGDYLTVPGDDTVDFGFSFPRRSLSPSDILAPSFVALDLAFSSYRAAWRLGRYVLPFMGENYLRSRAIVRKMLKL